MSHHAPAPLHTVYSLTEGKEERKGGRRQVDISAHVGWEGGGGGV
jgi:hypothetical protein